MIIWDGFSFALIYVRETHSSLDKMGYFVYVNLVFK